MKAFLPDGWNTYLGIVVAMAPTIASWFGYVPSPEFSGEFEQTVLAVVTLAGGAYALYGKARHQIPRWFAKK